MNAQTAYELRQRQEQAWFVGLLQHRPTRELLRRICLNRRAGEAVGFPRYDASDYLALGRRQLADEYADKVALYGNSQDILEIVHGKEPLA